MRQFSSEFKEAIVVKLCSPGGPTYSQVAAESGIGLSTLHRWVQLAGGRKAVKQKKRPQDWDSVERLRAVFEASGLDETKLGEFLRRNGLHSSDLEAWKAEALSDAGEKRQRGRPKLDPEVVALRQETERLKRDLRRKDKALAEASALIILKKRAEEIWGKDEDDE